MHRYMGATLADLLEKRGALESADCDMEREIAAAFEATCGSTESGGAAISTYRFASSIILMS